MQAISRLVLLSSSILLSNYSYSTTPVGLNCKQSPSFELSELGFAFEFSSIKNIKVLNGTAASALIEFNNTLADLHIITTDEAQITGGINKRAGYEKLGISNFIELIEKAQTSNSKTNDEYFNKVKQALRLNEPNQIKIIKHSKAGIIVLKDEIIIIRHNDPRIIMLAAEMNEQQSQILLQNLCL